MFIQVLKYKHPNCKTKQILRAPEKRDLGSDWRKTPPTSPQAPTQAQRAPAKADTPSTHRIPLKEIKVEDTPQRITPKNSRVEGPAKVESAEARVPVYQNPARSSGKVSWTLGLTASQEAEILAKLPKDFSKYYAGPSFCEAPDPKTLPRPKFFGTAQRNFRVGLARDRGGVGYEGFRVF